MILSCCLDMPGIYLGLHGNCYPSIWIMQTAVDYQE
uniref:Uncharacterized protein n=1 Tax=Arundo donax TaxID=35708 RepID=A0A0A9A7W1_ARUDO